MGRHKKAADGALETAVMNALWECGGSMTTSEVMAALKYDATLAYNTVTTIMTRLHDKGRLERERDGRAFTYRPVQTREEYTATRMAQVLSETGDRPVTLAQFVGSLDHDDQTQLRRLLEHLRRKN